VAGTASTKISDRHGDFPVGMGALHLNFPSPVLHFIPKETFCSLKQICHSFAALIQHNCIKWKLFVSPDKVNQDVGQHHFANVKQSCISNSGANQVECMGAIKRSAVTRMENV
jgi:hypothetical protein